MNRSRLALAAVALCAGTTTSAYAGDSTWDNGGLNFTWDTSSFNWSGLAWNNAGGDGAIFGPTGVGTINVAEPISVDSMNFTTDGYVLNGAGSLNFVIGSSTQTTGVVNVAAGATAKINVGINNSMGFQKIGAGTLELSKPCTFTGGFPMTGSGNLRADVIVGGVNGPIASGTLRVMNSSVLPTSTRVGIGNGYLDIGSNNVTISQLTFTNQTGTTASAWNTTLNANNGVIGSGTLRVTGEINVLGVNGNNQGNSIAANLDLGGGTQIVRCGLVSSIGLQTALMFTGTISNGSLLKTIGWTAGGIQSSVDGIGLYGNNTYTGATILNSGTNIASGTNQSGSIKIAGIPAGPAGGSFALVGANGSFQQATSIQAVAGGTFILDNNAAFGANGLNQPNIAAAQNNDRIRDDAQIELRDGNFAYRGRSAVAASETFGSLNASGGHNILTLTPNGTGGTATVTASGNLSLVSRATLQISSATLGAASKLFVNGTLPAADATGILPRMVGSSDFLTYNAVTGMTPYTGYATNFATPGTNVAVTAASTVASTVSINALKTTGSFTTTIGAGQTLNVASGMILNTSGTQVIAGGTLDFGAKPGVLFGGTTNITAPITGSAGLINASSTSTLSGDLSGLTGTITTNNGTTTLSTNTFKGALEVRAGTLNIGTSQTLAGAGAITLGVSANDSNLIGLVPTLSFSAAGANAVINRDVIVDNGAQTAAGAELAFSTVTRLSPLSNATGSQTLSGNFTLNSPVNLQGGAGGGTGSTNFTGDVSGPSLFILSNGRANFSGNISNAGGFLIGNTGFTALVSFTGTGSGNGPMRVNGGTATTVSYKKGALTNGTITVQNVGFGSSAPVFFPLDNSVINNSVVLNGSTAVNVASGITAEWAGPLSGGSSLSKLGIGTMVLSSTASTHTGAVTVSAGTLRVNGVLPSSGVSVANAATLGGVGVLTGNVSVAVGGTLAPGNSVGTLTTGNTTLLGTLSTEIDLNNGGPASADLLAVTGFLDVSGGTLDLPLLNAPSLFAGATIMLVDNQALGAVSGTFASITGLPLGYTATIDYAYAGTDILGRVGNGNDIAIVLVPAPGSLMIAGAFGVSALRRRRR